MIREILSVVMPMGICVVLVLSLYGLGTLPLILIKRRSQTTPQIPALLVGFTLFTVLGGVLAAFHQVSLTVLLGLFFIGTLRTLLSFQNEVVPSIASLRPFFPSKKNIAFYILGLSFLGLIIFETSLLYRPFFNVHDDYQSYLVSIQKLLHLGWFGEDPLNLRLLVSSLGAHSFVMSYAFVLADEDILYLFEYVLGAACLFSVLHWNVKAKGDSPFKLWIALVIFVLLSKNIVNVTSTFTVVSLFYGYLLFSQRNACDVVSEQYAIVVQALCASTLICLKTTYLPSLGILVVLSLFFEPAPWGKRLKRLGRWTFFVSFFCLGWVIAHWQATGSAFFPFVGQGYLCHPFPTYLLDEPIPWLERCYNIIEMLLWYPTLLLCLFSALAWRFIGPWSSSKKYVVCLFLAPLVMGFVILAKTGPFVFDAANNVLRYVAPLCQAIVLFIVVNELKGSQLSVSWFFKSRKSLLWVLCLIYPMALLCMERFDVTQRYWQMTKARRANEALHSPVLAMNDLRKAQASIPPGKTVYSRLSRANVLDYRRNKIFVADFPNQMSLTQCLPQLPIDPYAFASYLLEQDIEYVIYNYKNEGGYPRSIFGPSATHKWSHIRENALQTFAMSDQLMLLMKSHRQLYNNGVHVVIDLKQPAARPQRK